MRPLEPDPQGLLSLKATAKHSSHFKERAEKKKERERDVGRRRKTSCSSSFVSFCSFVKGWKNQDDSSSPVGGEGEKG